MDAQNEARYCCEQDCYDARLERDEGEWEGV